LSKLIRASRVRITDSKNNSWQNNRRLFEYNGKFNRWRLISRNNR